MRKFICVMLISLTVLFLFSCKKENNSHKTDDNSKTPINTVTNQSTILPTQFLTPHSSGTTPTPTSASGISTLEKCNTSNVFSWSKVEDVSYSMYKNFMMVKIPKSALGISTSNFTIQFKWTDNCTTGDIDSFYTDGDAAPIGRLNYVYSVK